MTESEVKTESGPELKTEVTPETKALIVRQVEHYFGDYNLPRDKFLKEEMDKAEGGWVTMDTMLKFKRLSALSGEAKVIMDALKEAKSDLVEVHETDLSIRRNPAQAIPEWNEDRKKALQMQTVYVKGFHKEDTKLDPLLKFFEKFDGVLNVQMRNYTNKKTDLKGFKGSVFVTFKDKESAEKFMETKVEGPEGSELTPLQCKWQLDYFADKAKEVEEKRKNDKANKDKIKAAKEEAKTEEDEKAEPKEQEREGLPKGSVLFLKNLTGEDTSREDIVSVLESEFGVNRQESIAFIYFQRGETEARLRFKNANAAVELLQRMKDTLAKKEAEADRVFKIKDVEVEFSVLEGEEEDAFLKKCVDDMRAHKGRGGSNRGHKRRGGFRGGPGGKRGRR